MIPDHVITLIIVLVALWILFRWGGLIFTLGAFYHFWNAQWGIAIACILIATYIELVKAGCMVIERAKGCRGPWV